LGISRHGRSAPAGYNICQLQFLIKSIFFPSKGEDVDKDQPEEIDSAEDAAPAETPEEGKKNVFNKVKKEEFTWTSCFARMWLANTIVFCGDTQQI